MKENIKDLVLRLNAIIETAIDGIITIDDKGIVETINKSAANMFEYEPKEVIGNNVSMLMPNPYHDEHDAYLENYNRTREPRIIGIGREVKGKRSSGEIFPLRLAVSEVILNDRVIFTGVVHDLSDLKEVELELKKTNENLEDIVEKRTNELETVVNKLLSTNKQLEKSQNELKKALDKEKELNELKSRFVSMASHEFRTPLSTVMSSASIISKYRKEEEDPKRIKHVDRIKSAVNNLTGILNDFLSLSKLEENKVDLKLDLIDFNQLCELTSDELKSILKSGQKIDHQCVGKVKLVRTDERILKNILFNLMSNAIKYSPENATIYCVTSFEHNHLKIEIKDEGIGIPKNEQKHLFDRFFRASNVENIQGTGLGLNIVKRYIDLLNGRISFTSEEGEGSCFVIEIPIK